MIFYISSNCNAVLDQFRSRLISQSFKDISVRQKLLRYFNGTIIWTFFVPLTPVWPVTFALILNASAIELATEKSIIVLLSAKSCSSLQYCHKVPDVFE